MINNKGLIHILVGRREQRADTVVGLVMREQEDTVAVTDVVEASMEWVSIAVLDLGVVVGMEVVVVGMQVVKYMEAEIELVGGDMEVAEMVADTVVKVELALDMEQLDRVVEVEMGLIQGMEMVEVEVGLAVDIEVAYKNNVRKDLSQPVWEKDDVKCWILYKLKIIFLPSQNMQP